MVSCRCEQRRHGGRLRTYSLRRETGGARVLIQPEAISNEHGHSVECETIESPPPPHPKKKDGLFCDIGDCIGLIDRLGVGEGRERVKRETSLFFPPFINADSTTFRSFFLERKHITSFRPDATPQRLSSFFITAAARPSHRTAKTGRAHRSHPQLLIASNRSMKAIWSSFTTSGTDRGGWGKKRHRLDKNKNRKRKSAPGGFTWWRRTKWKRRRRRRR